MWSGKIKKKIQLVALLVIFVVPILTETTNGQAENPGPFFSISVLAPNTYGYTYATLMVEQLPKIGISVDVFDYTGWTQITERTWGYPGPYPVPSYAEGGFDILCIGWGLGLDVDFTELFDSANITPNKWNFYQYDRPEMDWALRNYSQSLVLADRIQYARDIQALLYEDVPQATVRYPQDVFPHDPNLVAESWSPLLWDTSYQDMAYYDIGDTEFHYGCPNDFEVFHTMKTESVYDAQWTQQIYGGLVERTPEAPYYNAYGPYACTSFSSSNGINYTIQLDPDLVFADGHVCNATDVEYSFDLLINPDFSQPDYSFYSQYIDNKTIEIVSEYEIKVNFLKYYVFQDSNLRIDILPKHIWGSILPENQENQASTWAADDVLDSQKILGIGPYYLHDYDGTNGVLHLKANTYWDTWGDHATQLVDDLYFEFWSNKFGALAALAAGDLNMVDSQFSPQLVEIPKMVDYTIVTTQGSKEIAFNCMHPYLGTGELCPINSPNSGKYIRQAISHMVPRDVIIAEIYNGIGSPGVTAFPEGAIGFDDTLEPYEYNIGLALHHMQLAGFDTGGCLVGSSTNLGLGFNTILSILAFIGGSVLIINRIKKKKVEV